MTDTRFEAALLKTLKFEGGVSANPMDPGGLTKWGVTQLSYTRWRVSLNLPARSVLDMTEDETHALYYRDYWLAAGCDKLPESLGFPVFDMAVNSGPDTAVKTLQKVLGVTVDGEVGPETIAAANGAKNVLLQFLKQRGLFYRDIVKAKPDQVVFLGGWISRLLEQAWGQA